MRKIALASVFGCFAFSLAATAFAQSEEFDKKPDDQLAADKQNKDEAGKKMPGEKDKPKVDDKVDPNMDPKEDPTKSYKFINLRFRDYVVPKFMINIFADGGATVNVFSFGPEMTFRKDGTEFDVGLSYFDFSMNPFMFKGHSDGEEAYEIVASTMKSVGLTIDLMHDWQLDDKGRFDLLVGGGVGIMGIFGNLYRSQASPVSGNTADPNDVTQWRACAGPSATPVTSSGKPFCDASNNHYTNGAFPSGSYAEASWANGGSKPFVLPYLSIPQISFRFKPIKQLQARADVGFSIFGFFWGLSAGTPLPF